MKATNPIGQRHSISFLAANDWANDSSAYWWSKTTCRILGHKDQLCEADGAIEWEQLYAG